MDEHQLHVRTGQRLVATPEHRDLGVVGQAGGNLLCRFVDHTAQGMIVQVPADAREVVHHRDAQRGELVRGADSGEQQQARGVDGAGAEHHLTAGADAVLGVVAAIPHSDTPTVVDLEPFDARVGGDHQVRTVRLDRGEVGGGDAVASTVGNGQIVPPRALLVDAVEVVGDGMTGLLRGGNEGRRRRVAGHRRRRPQRSGVPAHLAIASRYRLRALEVGKDRVVRPSLTGHLGPPVEVGSVPPEVHHRVDTAAAAESVTTGPRVDGPVGTRLRDGAVGVVDGAPPQRRPGRWRREVGGVVPTAALEQQHGDVGVLAQPRGHDTAGGSSPDDDVIEFVVHGSTPPRGVPASA